MSRYIAIIDYDEASGKYGAYFPDAPGATAMGATEAEVIADAIEALAEWVADEVADGRPAPVPRTYMQLLKSNEFDPGQGGMIATVPLLRESGKPVRANVSIDAGLLETIDKEAERLGLTRSAFLASAAREKIKASA
ncbi:type II toxin-antitoxin system HicB family antitoxin [Taklimakanibacter deserti]|uniref:type II toxin-antitoxin system HicB family antitoxin n=1 Tax=Taklimakanibacter deserti TaxID=2267839 RepID=UPI000E650198